MIKNRRLAPMLGCFLLALAFLCVLLPSYAQGAEMRTVRVGFFAFDGYHMLDEEGRPSGYGYELLQHLLGYTDWEYVYLGYDKSWSEAQDMLECGEIDLLTSAQITDSRLRHFSFSDLSIGTSAAILTVKAGDSRYSLQEYSAWNGMRIGMIENNSRNEDLSEFAATHGFTYEPVYFTELDDMVAALKAGDGLDAVLTSNLRSIDGEWVLAQFSPSPFYIMVRKDDNELLAQVNQGLERLFTDEPELRTNLMAKYYTPDNGEEIAFTPEERVYLAAHAGQPLTALINPDRAPYSYFVDGQAQGIFADLIQLLSDRSGLCFRLLETADRAAYRQAIANREADVRFDAWYNYPEAEEQGYRLTLPYLEVPVARLYTRDSQRLQVVALLRESDLGNNFQASLAQQYERVDFYETTTQMVDAILTGQADVAYLYGGSAELAVQTNVTNQLLFENLYGSHISFAAAVSANQDSLLFSILNKTIASLSQEDVDAIVLRHTTYKQTPFSFFAYCYNHPLLIAVLVAALFLLVILIGFAVSQTRKRRREAVCLVDEQRRNQLLNDALASAEKADAAKSQFFSRVSHEMRTPLNAIIGFLSLAQDAPESKMKVYLENSQIAAKQLLSVINDVLDMSAIESGKLKLSVLPFDFKQLIHSIGSIYLAQCEEKGLEFETRLLTPVDEKLVGDALRLKQILVNLLGNALKFTAKGHIWLHISQLNTEPSEKVFLRFTVSDTGCGISEDMQKRLFRPFEQEDAETAQRYGGSGLGLSIVSNLVSMLGGAIRVESQLEQGTTFVVDLPFLQDQNEGNCRIDSAIENLRLLVVDDQEGEREYISAVLKRLHIRHACAADGREAIEVLAEAFRQGEPYDICLVDWKMPDLDGIQLTRMIRQLYGRRMVIVLSSAYEPNLAEESATEAGADYFVSKPLFQSSLFDLLMSLTSNDAKRIKRAALKSDYPGKRALLAEDNVMNRLVAEGMLEKFGLVCDTAENGAMAVERFASSEPGYYDVILMDIQMPQMDGFAATRAIRAATHPQSATIPIIALTANAFNEDIAKSLSSGMDDHVSKPIDPAALLAALERVFEKQERNFWQSMK